MALLSKFTEHPASVGETYGQHFAASMRFSLGLLRGAFVCAVHAVLPWVFESSGSRCISDLYARMVANRGAGTAGGDGTADANEA
jgi:hypothetical protein